MGLFSNMFGKKDNSSEIISSLKAENKKKDARIKQLEALCEEKDSYFSELMSDGLRHGSSLAGKHMADYKKYKKGK